MRTRAGRHTPRSSARRSVAAVGGDHTGRYPDDNVGEPSDDYPDDDSDEYAGGPDARRDDAGDRESGRAGLRPRAGRRSAAPIIGGSVVDTLMGRSRGRYAIADLESSTAELAIITAGTRRGGRARRSRPGRSPLGRSVLGRSVLGRSVLGRSLLAPTGRAPMGIARQRLRRRRQQLATLAIGIVTAVGLVAGVVAIVWSEPAPEPASPAVAAPGDTGAVPAAGEQPATDQDQANAGEPDAEQSRPTEGAELDADSAAQNGVDASLNARDTESYLDGLRTADIEVSDDGQAEREAGEAICEQLQRGVDPLAIERALPAMLTTVNRRQAPTVVDLAERYYCV